MKLAPQITLTIVALTTLASSSHAIESAAGSSLDVQMTWSTLKSMVDSAMTTAKGAQITADDARTRTLKLETCSKQQMLYAPSATLVANGCYAPWDDTRKLVSKIEQCNNIQEFYDPKNPAANPATGCIKPVISSNAKCAIQYRWVDKTDNASSPRVRPNVPFQTTGWSNPNSWTYGDFSFTLWDNSKPCAEPARPCGIQLGIICK